VLGLGVGMLVRHSSAACPASSSGGWSWRTC
jgi:hypothetical protein